MFKRFFEQHNLSDYHFSGDIFPTVEDRAFWEAFQNETCVKEAESELNYGWPTIKATDFMEFKKSGNRKIMETVHFDRRHHFALFALAELKENKGRFLPQIVNGLFAICEESFWGLSAHWEHGTKNIPTPAEPWIDLYAAETAEHLAMIATLLRGPLTEFCPEILDRIEYELEKRIKVPYLAHDDYWWMGNGKKRTNNWNPWILSNLLTAFLLTEKNEQRLRHAVHKMFDEAQNYYASLPADGGCDEGPSYWGRAGASLFEFLYQIKQATDGELNLFGDEKLGQIAAYLKKVHVTADRFINVSDAHNRSCAGLMPLLYGFARETKQEKLKNFSAAVYQQRESDGTMLKHTLCTMRRLIYHSEFIREMEQYPVALPLHGAIEALPMLELAAIRNGDLFLSAKGGHNNESHNHNDVGSFTFYDGTTPVLIDVGISTYTRFTFQSDTRYTMIPWTRSLYHNLPVVNGTEQKTGPEFRADRFETEEGKIAISYAEAYPVEAEISSLVRTLTLNENGMTCTDQFAFAGQDATKVTEVLMSILPVRAEKDAVILGDRYRVGADCGRIDTEFVPFEDATLEGDWHTEGVTRILIHAEGKKQIKITVEKI